MAFKIKAADQKRIDAAFGELTAQRSTLEESVRVFNEAVAAARATLQLDVDAYNEKVDAARGVLDDVHRELEDEFDDKSANWQNGDKGIATKEWIDTISALAEELLDMIRAPAALEYPKDDRPASFDGHDFVPIVFGAIEDAWRRVN